MAQKINVPLPDEFVIGDGWTVEWDAVDASTGASVAGVVVSDANLTAVDLSSGAGTGGETVGPFMLVPGPGA